jgi:hypothetical protein
MSNVNSIWSCKCTLIDPAIFWTSFQPHSRDSPQVSQTVGGHKHHIKKAGCESNMKKRDESSRAKQKKTNTGVQSNTIQTANDIIQKTPKYFCII